MKRTPLLSCIPQVLPYTTSTISSIGHLLPFDFIWHTPSLSHFLDIISQTSCLRPFLRTHFFDPFLRPIFSRTSHVAFFEQCRLPWVSKLLRGKEVLREEGLKLLREGAFKGYLSPAIASGAWSDVSLLTSGARAHLVTLMCGLPPPLISSSVASSTFCLKMWRLLYLLSQNLTHLPPLVSQRVATLSSRSRSNHTLSALRSRSDHALITL
jgi:hypothetical protein